MAGIISISEQFIIQSITYESGDKLVKACGEMRSPDGEVSPLTMLISHTDMNRIMAKMAAEGFDFSDHTSGQYDLEDGSQMVEYRFDNETCSSFTINDFYFMNEMKQIRA